MTLTTSSQEQDWNLWIYHELNIIWWINKDWSTTIQGYSKLANFPWSIIIRTKDIEWEIIWYAIRSNSRGNLEWNKIVFWKNWEIKFTYQLHNLNEDKLEEMWILWEYTSAIAREIHEKLDKSKAHLMWLFIKWTWFDPFQWSYPWGQELENARNSVSTLSNLEQIELAKYFFNKTIWENIGNIRSAYNVYWLFINLPFWWKFWEMEDKRLKSNWYKQWFYNLKPHNYKNCN